MKRLNIFCIISILILSLWGCGTSEEPVKPEEPENTETPDKPEEPENPGEPGNTEDPNTPPEEPQDPGKIEGFNLWNARGIYLQQINNYFNRGIYYHTADNDFNVITEIEIGQKGDDRYIYLNYPDRRIRFFDSTLSSDFSLASNGYLSDIKAFIRSSSSGNTYTEVNEYDYDIEAEYNATYHIVRLSVGRIVTCTFIKYGQYEKNIVTTSFTNYAFMWNGGLLERIVKTEVETIDNEEPVNTTEEIKISYGSEANDFYQYPLSISKTLLKIDYFYWCFPMGFFGHGPDKYPDEIVITDNEGNSTVTDVDIITTQRNNGNVISSESFNGKEYKFYYTI